MIQTTDTRGVSVGHLFKDLADESRMLLRQEVQLAKTEMSEKISVYVRNLVYLAVGVCILLAGLLPMVAAACIGAILVLDNLMDAEIALWLGPLIVGVVLALVGYALVQKAISTFRSEHLAPEKTIETMRENKEWLKDQMTTSDQRTSASRVA